jgi:riboflavin kinase / FMN adenylyltransferase
MTSEGKSSVVAIGVFDGVHFGHQALTSTAVAIAQTNGLKSIALTFNPHPMAVVRGMDIQSLTSILRRRQLLTSLGIEHVHVCDFGPIRAGQSPAEFIREVLVNELGATHVVVGKGFRFGRGAAGTVEDFREAGLIVQEVDQVLMDGARVSSTRIRETIAAGDISAANQMLTRSHRYQGIVVGGLKRGRDLGYPTANLKPLFTQAAPADGVYAGYLSVLNANEETIEKWPAAISVGTNPTFDDVAERVVEAYALDQTDLDLYDKLVAVDFVARIRPMLAFSSISELVDEMAQDVLKTKDILGPVAPLR